MMLTSTERKLLQTIQTVTSDADASAWEDHKNDALHVEATLGSGKRHFTFDHVSKHDLADLDEQQRADVISRLFANAGAWPAGTAEVRCLRDVLETPRMVTDTDFQVFVDDAPVSRGVRISTQMRPKS